MKKVYLLFVIVALAAAVFTSCKKCETCTAYYESNDEVYQEDHLCGSNLVVNNWETQFKSDYDYGSWYVICETD